MFSNSTKPVTSEQRLLDKFAKCVQLLFGIVKKPVMDIICKGFKFFIPGSVQGSRVKIDYQIMDNSDYYSNHYLAVKSKQDVGS